MIDPRLLRLPELENFNGLTEEITRQIRDSLFFLSSLRAQDEERAFTEAQVACFLEMARWYIECTIDEQGNLQTRRTEINRSGRPEPVANHPLRTLDIGLGLFDRMQMTPEVEGQEWFQKVDQQSFELILSLLLHDSLEDEKKFHLRTSEAELRKKLGEVFDRHFPRFSQELKLFLIHRQIAKIRTLSILPEEKANGGMHAYLARVWNDPVCRLIKAADIVQNALSPHTESQQQKYRDHYVAFLLRVLSVEGFCSHHWLNLNVINRMMKANPYLEEVFAEAGHEGWVFTQFAGRPIIKYQN